MLSKLADIFRIQELRKRILITLGLLAVYRIGIFITAPGVDRDVMKGYLGDMQSQGGGFLNLFNFFSGGALENASIFALGIMPYITASIIMSLLGVIVPTVERLQKEGEQGRKKINQYTRYGTILIAVMQGVMISKYLLSQSFNGQGIVNPNWAQSMYGMGFIMITVITLAAGTAFIMWLGEKITEHGIGNGISLVIFAGIVARLPSAVYATFVGVKNGTYQPSEMLLLGVVILAVLAGIVFVEKGQRRLPIQYAKRVIGNRQYGGQSSHLPLKINVAGVIPPIFASAILMFPSTLASMIQIPALEALQRALMPGSWMYQAIYIAMIIFFAYFYTAVQFRPVDVADNLKKSGGFIPGVRAGKATAEYIDYVLSRVTFGGAIYLSLVCVTPVAIQKLSTNQVPFFFGGTGLLIVVSVALDTVQQIEGHYIARHYDNMTKRSADGSSSTATRIRARQRNTGGSLNKAPA